MGVTLCLLRMNENLHRLEEDNLQISEISRKIRKLANFSSAVADGSLSPSEIGGLGEFYFNALELMDNADILAAEVADAHGSYYENLLSDITAREYYQNSSLMNEVSLYFDEDGKLDLTKTKSKIYEEALEDYVEKFVKPTLQEYETELENEKAKLETEAQQLEAEYDALKDARDQAIQRQTIQLA